MRRRPKLQVFLKPATAVAGSEVLAELVLTSKAETPVDAITLTLRGQEHVTVGEGWVSASIVAQRAAFGPRTLERGEHRVSARFVIPDDAPPTHRGRLVMVDYELEVHVDIPWWPDRRERYLVAVTRRPLPLAAPSPPTVFTNRKSAPNELHLEATIDDTRIEQGGVITGAVSFANVARKRVRSVDLVFQPREAVTSGDAPPVWLDGAALVSTILDRAPSEGETVPFRVKLPEDAAPTFSSRRARVTWSFSIVARVAFADDVTIALPILVSPAARRGAGAARRRTVLPPIGRERRALLVQAAAERLGLEVDAVHEELRGDAGLASLTIRLERREQSGLLAVAELSWPALGMSLAVRERRWTDAFGGAIDLDDAAFHQRVHVVAADADRARRMLDESLRAALVALTEIEIDDEGAVLAGPVSVTSSESMTGDLRPLVDAAQLLGSAVARVSVSAYR
ncbi:MAG: hypothetical protein HYV09_31355 [Deltaproteobacteria bacterium]|nr:hypothetical protein [Deltaproteobacteria bacterium]